MKIDITLLCGSRPELLELTLASFKHHTLANFGISNVYANVDLFGGGGEVERKKCISLITSHFPKAEISTPETSSFGAAVKKLWSLPSTDYFLHLEDDWVCNRKITPADLENKINRFDQITLARNEIHRSLFTGRNFRPFKYRFFRQIDIPNFTKPQFSTSPSFMKSSLANLISDLLDPNLHPEKQLYNDLNPKLSDLLIAYRAINISRWWNSPFISDIGRAWHLKQVMSLGNQDGLNQINHS